MQTRRNGSQKKNFWTTFALVIVVLLACFLLGNKHQKVVITLTPEKVLFETSHQAPAYEVASINVDNEPALESIPIVPVNFEYTAKRAIEDVPTEHVSTKSIGSVTLINMNTTTQLLSEGTRFIDPATKNIYMLMGDKVVLPSGTKDNPSRTEAKLEAAEPGEGYNMPSGTLQVFAWQSTNDPRNELQYAEIGVGGIAGGFEGEKPLMDAGVEEKLVDELKKELQFVLREKAYSLSLTGAFKIDSKTSLTYGEPRIDTLKATPEISLRGTYQIFLMQKEDWYSYVRNNMTSTLETVQAIVVRPSEQSVPEFVLGQGADGPYIAQKSETVFIKKPDQPAILHALYYQPISHIPDIIKDLNFPIESVEVQVQPFWLTRVPEDASKIEVKIDTVVR